ncbi:hypothetical protein C8J56DRAFT_894058 [Mycena floridula]|nr:hypothetical protein C8J56DRAFT_894058 [Mycena floridula]
MAQPPFRKSGFRSAPTFDGPPQGKRFSGLKCPEKFSNRTSLKQPVVKHRPAGPGGRTFTGEGHSFTGFDCDGCEKRFSDKKTLEAHRKHDHISCCDKHDNEPAKVCCTIVVLHPLTLKSKRPRRRPITELSINQDDIQDVTDGSRSSWIVSQVEETLPTPTLVAHTFEEDQGSLELDRIYELIRHSSEWYPGTEMASNGPSDPDTLAVITPPRGSPSIQDRMASQLIERPRMMKYDPWLDEEPLELQVHVKRTNTSGMDQGQLNDIDYDDHVLVDRALVHGPRLSEAPSRNCLAAHVDGFISFRPATNSTANVNLAQAPSLSNSSPTLFGFIKVISRKGFYPSSADEKAKRAPGGGSFVEKRQIGRGGVELIEKEFFTLTLVDGHRSRLLWTTLPIDGLELRVLKDI